MRRTEEVRRERGSLGNWRLGIAALAFVSTMSLSACAEEIESTTGGTQSAGETTGATSAGTTMETTGSTTMATTGGTTMSGTTGGGTTMGGTTMSGTTSGGTTMSGGTTQGGGIANVQELFIQDPQSLVGQEVNISDVEVRDTVGDTTFFVGPGADETVLASVEGVQSGGGDPGADINQGQSVQLTGTVEELPSPRGLERFGLNQSEIQDLEGQEIYLSLSQVESAS